jgi:alpha-tubulin suppressor-like RCC1 family protein
VHGKGSSSRIELIGGKGREETLLFGCGMVCGQQRPTPWLMNATGFGLAAHPLVRVQCVAAGGKHALLVDGSGAVWSWGVNTSGQLGIEGSRKLLTPTCIPLLYQLQGPAIKVAAGHEHSLVLTASRLVYTFGRNDTYQLGLHHQHNQSSPQQVAALAPPLYVEDIAAGSNHSLCATSQRLHAGVCVCVRV